jgi:hypothetical protein
MNLVMGLWEEKLEISCSQLCVSCTVYLEGKRKVVGTLSELVLNIERQFQVGKIFYKSASSGLFDLKRTSSTFPAQLRSPKYQKYLHTTMIFVNRVTGNPKVWGLYIYAKRSRCSGGNTENEEFATKSQIWWFH